MKKRIALLVLFAATTAWAAPNPADYTVDVHVVSSRMEQQYGGKGVTTSLILNVVIGGHKYELTDTDTFKSFSGLIIPGNYKAKNITKDSDTQPGGPQNNYLTGGKFQMLFPDGKTEKFTVTGVTE